MNPVLKPGEVYSTGRSATELHWNSAIKLEW